MSESFRIITDGPKDWIVVTAWLGSERTVFRGSLFGCIAFTVENF